MIDKKTHVCILDVRFLMPCYNEASMKTLVLATRFFFIRVAFVLLCSSFALSQIDQIDRSKLPPDSAVQNAYSDLASINQFARTYETKWRFSISKDDVTSRFLVNLHVLEAAQKLAPINNELQLLTGLVAHLAYNLNIEEAYDPAVKLLQLQASEDFRAAWFLGTHQCQSNNPVGGMQNFLHVETLAVTLPRAFWQDYANCATVANMPVRAVRAYDNAHKISSGPETDGQLEQLARNRIKTASITATYPARQIWSAEKVNGDGVRFISYVCGESFVTKESNPVDIPDVANGSCAVTISTEKYPVSHGGTSASFLILSQATKPAETLEAFSQRFLSNPKYSGKTPASGIPCPAKDCLSFEIITDKLYKSEGGAHLLAIFFRSEQPDYPGLRYETPQPLPTTDKNGQPVFFRAAEALQRFPGNRYFFIALDSNQEIYSRARAEFDDFLKSLVIDSR